MRTVQKPVTRSSLRRRIGREWFIVRRRLADSADRTRWATLQNHSNQILEPTVVFSHASPIRRELAGVDMALQDNKKINLQLAVREVDRVQIRPGESFSLWRLVGRPTRRRGFVEGLVLDQGEVSSGTGGGLCQLSNLLFWLFAHSPLTISERHRHTFDVFPDSNRTVPFGAGATVAYNYIDLRVVNHTTVTFELDLRVTNDELQGRLLADAPLPRSFDIVERNHRFERQTWGGWSRHNDIVRISTAADGTTNEELLAHNDALLRYEPMLPPAESQSNCYDPRGRNNSELG